MKKVKETKDKAKEEAAKKIQKASKNMKKVKEDKPKEDKAAKEEINKISKNASNKLDMINKKLENDSNNKNLIKDQKKLRIINKNLESLLDLINKMSKEQTSKYGKEINDLIKKIEETNNKIVGGKKNSTRKNRRKNIKK